MSVQPSLQMPYCSQGSLIGLCPQDYTESNQTQWKHPALCPIDRNRGFLNNPFSSNPTCSLPPPPHAPQPQHVSPFVPPLTLGQMAVSDLPLSMTVTGGGGVIIAFNFPVHKYYRKVQCQDKIHKIIFGSFLHPSAPFCLCIVLGIEHRQVFCH